MPVTGAKRPSHATIVAYTALVLALGGSAFAATGGGGGRNNSKAADAHAAHRSNAIKVRCTATRGGRRVACSVVGTRGVIGPRGPAGPKGATGPPGPAGPAGPTSFTQQAAFVGHVLPDGQKPPQFSFVSTGEQTLNGVNVYQQMYTQDGAGGALTDAPGAVQMPLLTPSMLDGTSAALSSVSFCMYSTPQSNPGNSSTSTISVANVSVVQYVQSTATGSVSVAQATSNVGGPAYTPKTMLSQDYSDALTDQSGCLTASTSTPQPIDPDGTLELVVTLHLTASGSGNPNLITNYIGFGRVTTTYAP